MVWPAANRAGAPVADPRTGEQAFGESLKGDKLEVLARHEVHLDRKLERVLSMLVRLRQLRQAPTPTSRDR
jgi:hypothetical protein